MWKSMSMDRFASLEMRTGSKVIKIGDFWWRQVRPLFYRPLLPFECYRQNRMDRFPQWSIFQFADCTQEPSLSHFNYIVFDAKNDYGLANLSRNARRNILNAQRNGLTSKIILIDNNFIDEAFSVYLSFYNRSHYSFEKKRLDRTYFESWMKVLSEYDELVMMGIFNSSGKLITYEITCLIDDVIYKKSIINSEEGIELHAPDLLLHSYRENLRSRNDIRCLFDGFWANSWDINYYKLKRGGRVVTVPARIHCSLPFSNLCGILVNSIRQIKGMNESEVASMLGKMGLN
jgi:hypothetical protein